MFSKDNSTVLMSGCDRPCFNRKLKLQRLGSSACPSDARVFHSQGLSMALRFSEQERVFLYLPHVEPAHEVSCWLHILFYFFIFAHCPVFLKPHFFKSCFSSFKACHHFMLSFGA